MPSKFFLVSLSSPDINNISQSSASNFTISPLVDESWGLGCLMNFFLAFSNPRSSPPLMFWNNLAKSTNIQHDRKMSFQDFHVHKKGHEKRRAGWSFPNITESKERLWRQQRCLQMSFQDFRCIKRTWKEQTRFILLLRKIHKFYLFQSEISNIELLPRKRKIWECGSLSIKHMVREVESDYDLRLEGRGSLWGMDVWLCFVTSHFNISTFSEQL